MFKPNTQIKAAAGLALSGLILTACTFGRPPQPETTQLQLPALQTPITEQIVFTVERGDVAQQIEFEGQISLAEQEELFFGNSGRVRSINVNGGDMVDAGTLIAEIDTRDLTFDLEEAALALELARQRLDRANEGQSFDLEDAQLELDIALLRLDALDETEDPDPTERSILQRQVDRAQLKLDRIAGGLGGASANDIDQLSVNVELAGLRFERLQASLADSQIVAPFDGEIRLYDVLAEGKAVNAFETVAVVVNPDSYAITANLVREDMEQLTEGMPVQLELPYLTGALVNGVINTLPQPFGSGAGTQTIISVTDPNDTALLRAGAGVNVSVDLAKSSETLWLPPSAVRGFGSNRFVTVSRQGVIQEIPVEIGLANSEQIEIVEGVEEGMQVLGQ